jgi:hypothetical protein
MTDPTPKAATELPLGFRGAVTLVLHPVIRLRPTRRTVVLKDSLTPALALDGDADNLIPGEVPCTLTWIVRKNKVDTEVPESRKTALRKKGSGYEVLADGKPLDKVDALALNLLGVGELGYRIRPATPREMLVVQPDKSGITFDYDIRYDMKSGAKVGEVLRIDPTKWPKVLDGLPVRLTVFDSDDPAAGKPYVFEWLLGQKHPETDKDALSWRFGCSTIKQPEGQDHESIVLDYCDHFEKDGNLEYAARLEVLDKLSAPKVKPKVKAFHEARNQWTGAVPVLSGFKLEKESSLLGDAGLAEKDERFQVGGTLGGFDPSVELKFELQLWATNGEEVRRAEDVLAEVRDYDQRSPRGVPRAIERQFELAGTLNAVVARPKRGVHTFEDSAFDIDELLKTVTDLPKAQKLLEAWNVFAELRLSPNMTRGIQRPMMQVARFGEDFVGVEQGVVGRRYSAAGVGSGLVSFDGLRSKHDALSEADWFDAYVLAMCVWTEARDNADLAKLRLEMLHVAGCIANRVKTKYTGNSFYEVVLAPKQFSHFNTDVIEKQVLVQAKKDGEKVDGIVAWASSLTGKDKTGWEIAVSVGEELVRNPAHNPFKEATVRHYYSPRSMKPPGTRPAWHDAAKKLTVPEISEERFVWFNGIP